MLFRIVRNDFWIEKETKRNFLISFEKEKNWKNKQKEITSNKK